MSKCSNISQKRPLYTSVNSFDPQRRPLLCLQHYTTLCVHKCLIWHCDKCLTVTCSTGWTSCKYFSIHQVFIVLYEPMLAANKAGLYFCVAFFPPSPNCYSFFFFHSYILPFYLQADFLPFFKVTHISQGSKAPCNPCTVLFTPLPVIYLYKSHSFVRTRDELFLWHTRSSWLYDRKKAGRTILMPF